MTANFNFCKKSVEFNSLLKKVKQIIDVVGKHECAV